MSSNCMIMLMMSMAPRAGMSTRLTNVRDGSAAVVLNHLVSQSKYSSFGEQTVDNGIADV